MNIGLIGWGIASGNGGMNTDIVSLSTAVTHWLIPEHPNGKNHQPYIDKASQFAELSFVKLKGDHQKYNDFLDKIDALLYIEHPILKDEKDYDIVHEAKKKGKLVIGIPMWEWWPERKRWSFETDILWAVTKFTESYLNSLSDVLFAQGLKHNWRHHVIYNQWGVNLNDFSFQLKTKIKNIVFINGNGGYKLRKASDIVFEAFTKDGAPPLTIYTQKDNIAKYKITKNITIIDKTFPERGDVYKNGDLFLFPSYWEGLCHGIYEGQACGSLVLTTDHPPMNECGTNYLLPVKEILQENLAGKKIMKSKVSADDLYKIVKSLYNKNIVEESINTRKHIENDYNLKHNLNMLIKKSMDIIDD
jgi:glycosyltransferase involved in cell wall biosynthesis